MTLSRLMSRAGAVACALVFALVPTLAAAQYGVPTGAHSAGGLPLETSPVTTWGLDSVTGQKCLVGTISTCQLPDLKNVSFAGTTTPLGGSATYTGTARDTGVSAGTPQPYAYFNGFFFADQTGTAYIDCSNDNSTWTVCATASLPASTPLILTVPVMFRYHRTRLVNGSSAEGTLVVNSSYTAG